MYHILLNADQLTYTFSHVEDAEDNTWDYLFKSEPKNSIFLVRVEGESGDSNGSFEKIWDVDVFPTREEAEALADAIDLRYDAYGLIEKNSSIIHMQKYLRAHMGDDRFVEVQKLKAEHDAITDPVKRRKHFDKNILGISYQLEGVEHREYAYWTGCFEKMYVVKVLEVTPEGTPRRWRDRRFTY